MRRVLLVILAVLMPGAIFAECPDLTGGLDAMTTGEVTLPTLEMVVFADGHSDGEGGMIVSTPHRHAGLDLSGTPTCGVVFLVPFSDGAAEYTEDTPQEGDLLMQIAMLQDSAIDFRAAAPAYFDALDADGRITRDAPQAATVYVLPDDVQLDLSFPVIAEILATREGCADGTALVSGNVVALPPCGEQS